MQHTQGVTQTTTTTTVVIAVFDPDEGTTTVGEHMTCRVSGVLTFKQVMATTVITTSTYIYLLDCPECFSDV
jgi:hypothetical protein